MLSLKIVLSIFIYVCLTARIAVIGGYIIAIENEQPSLEYFRNHFQFPNHVNLPSFLLFSSHTHAQTRIKLLVVFVFCLDAELIDFQKKRKKNHFHFFLLCITVAH